MTVPYNFLLDEETARKFEELRLKNYRNKTQQLRFMVDKEYDREFTDQPADQPAECEEGR